MQSVARTEALTLRYTQAVRTADGRLFGDEDEARRHAQKRYDDAMTTLRGSLTTYMLSLREAGKAMEWIENNFAAIARAAELRNDITFEETEE